MSDVSPKPMNSNPHPFHSRSSPSGMISPPPYQQGTFTGRSPRPSPRPSPRASPVPSSRATASNLPNRTASDILNGRSRSPMAVAPRASQGRSPAPSILESRAVSRESASAVLPTPAFVQPDSAYSITPLGHVECVPAKSFSSEVYVRAMARAGGSVWVATHDGQLEIRNAQSGAVEKSISRAKAGTPLEFQRRTGKDHPNTAPGPTDTRHSGALAGSREKRVPVWGCTDSAVVPVFVLSLLSVPATGTVWAGTSSGQIGIWSAKTLSLADSLNFHVGAVHALALGAGAVFSGGADFKIAEWDAVTGAFLRQYIGHNNTVKALVASASPLASTNVLVSGADDGAVIVWETTAGEARKRFEPADFQVEDHGPGRNAPVAGITSLALRGAHVWIGDTRGTVSVVSIAPTVSLMKVFLAHSGRIMNISVIGRRIWTASEDGNVSVWNADSMALVAQETMHGAKYVARVVVPFRNETSNVWTAGSDGRICFWASTDLNVDDTGREDSGTVGSRVSGLAAENDRLRAENAHLKRQLDTALHIIGSEDRQSDADHSGSSIQALAAAAINYVDTCVPASSVTSDSPAGQALRRLNEVLRALGSTTEVAPPPANTMPSGAAWEKVLLRLSAAEKDARQQRVQLQRCHAEGLSAARAACIDASSVPNHVLLKAFDTITSVAENMQTDYWTTAQTLDKYTDITATPTGADEQVEMRVLAEDAIETRRCLVESQARLANVLSAQFWEALQRCADTQAHVLENGELNKQLKQLRERCAAAEAKAAAAAKRVAELEVIQRTVANVENAETQTLATEPSECSLLLRREDEIERLKKALEDYRRRIAQMGETISSFAIHPPAPTAVNSHVQGHGELSAESDVLESELCALNDLLDEKTHMLASMMDSHRALLSTMVPASQVSELSAQLRALKDENTALLRRISDRSVSAEALEKLRTRSEEVASLSRAVSTLRGELARVSSILAASTDVPLSSLAAPNDVVLSALAGLSGSDENNVVGFLQMVASPAFAVSHATAAAASLSDSTAAVARLERELAAQKEAAVEVQERLSNALLMERELRRQNEELLAELGNVAGLQKSLSMTRTELECADTEKARLASALRAAQNKANEIEAKAAEDLKQLRGKLGSSSPLRSACLSVINKLRAALRTEGDAAEELPDSAPDDVVASSAVRVAASVCEYLKELATRSNEAASRISNLMKSASEAQQAQDALQAEYATFKATHQGEEHLKSKIAQLEKDLANRVSAYREFEDSSNEELSDLRNQLRVCRGDLADAKAEQQRLSERLAEADARVNTACAEHHSEIARLRHRLSDAHSSEMEAQVKAKDAVAQLAALNEASSELVTLRQAVHAVNTQLGSALIELPSTEGFVIPLISDAEPTAAVLSRSVGAAGAIHRLLKLWRESADSLEDVSMDANRKAAEATSKLANAEHHWRDQLAEVKARNSALERELAMSKNQSMRRPSIVASEHSDADFMRLRNQLQNADGEIERLQTALGVAQQDAALVPGLREDLADALADNERIMTELSGALEECGRLKSQLSEARSAAASSATLRSNEADRAALRQAKQEVGSLVGALRSIVSILGVHDDSAPRSPTGSSEKIATMAVGTARNADEIIEVLQRRVQDLEAEGVRLQSEMAEAQAIVQDLQSMAQEANHLRGVLRDLEEELTNSKAENAEMFALRKRVSSLNNTVDSLTQQLNDVKGENRELFAQNAEISTLRSRVASLNKTVDSLTDQLNANRAELKTDPNLELLLRTAQANASRAESMAEREKHEASALSSKLQDTSKALSESRESEQALGQLRDQLRREIAALTNQRDELSVRVAALENQVATRTRDLADMKSKFEDASQRNDQLSNEVSQLKKVVVTKTTTATAEANQARADLIRNIWALFAMLKTTQRRVRAISKSKKFLQLQSLCADFAREFPLTVDQVDKMLNHFEYIVSNFFTPTEKLHCGTSAVMYPPTNTTHKPYLNLNTHIHREVTETTVTVAPDDAPSEASAPDSRSVSQTVQAPTPAWESSAGFRPAADASDHSPAMQAFLNMDSQPSAAKSTSRSVYQRP